MTSQSERPERSDVSNRRFFALIANVLHAADLHFPTRNPEAVAVPATLPPISIDLWKRLAPLEMPFTVLHVYGPRTIDSFSTKVSRFRSHTVMDVHVHADSNDLRFGIVLLNL
mmetsp:Transcript_5679/g.11341  ORF Transcript_5679/g.11341 Transcript_5679/m.11341 type:complete len:113 (-) Transcript_5679:349-687(-)